MDNACLHVKHVIKVVQIMREGGGRREGGDEADMYKCKSNIRHILLCKQWEVLVIKRKLHHHHVSSLEEYYQLNT